MSADKLLSAIRRNRVDQVKALVNEQLLPNAKEPLLPPEELPPEKLMVCPLVYAVLKKRADIVHFLVNTVGHRIPFPHEESCGCVRCTTIASDTRFARQYVTCILFSLAAPVYVFSIEDDSFDFCIRLMCKIKKLRHRLFCNARFLFHRVRQIIDENICQMLEACESDDEVIALLSNSVDDDLRGLDNDDVYLAGLGRIQILCDLKLRKSVVHRSSQIIIYYHWYEGLEFIGSNKWLAPVKSIFLAIICYFFLIPVAIICPFSKLMRILRCPMMISYLEIIAVVIFVTIILLTSNTENDTLKNVFCEPHNMKSFVSIYVILIFIVARIFRESLEISIVGGRRYFINLFDKILSISNGIQLAGLLTILMWSTNIHDKAKIYTPFYTQLCFTANFTSTTLDVCSINATLTDLNHFTYAKELLKPECYGNILLSFGQLLIFLSLGNIFCWNKVTGVLTFTFQKMLSDIARFCLLMALMWMAWTSAISSLYQNYSCGTSVFGGFLKTGRQLYWAIYSMSSSSDYVVDETVFNSPSILPLTRSFGFILYGFYVLIASIVAVNLLIAMMTATFEDIQANKNDKWLYSKTKRQIKFLLLEPYFANYMPVPYILMAPIQYLSRALTKHCSFCSVIRKQTLDATSASIDMDLISNFSSNEFIHMSHGCSHAIVEARIKVKIRICCQFGEYSPKAMRQNMFLNMEEMDDKDDDDDDEDDNDNLM